MTYLFGGTFDPPHAGHAAIVRYLLARSPISTVIVMPAPEAPLRDGEKFFTFRQRFHLLRVMFRREISGGRVMLSALEHRLASPHYTINTLEALQKFCPEKPTLVIGADQAQKLPHWHRSHDLMANYSFVIFSRPGIVPAPLPEIAHEAIEDFSFDVSSTQVRAGLSGLSQEVRYQMALRLAEEPS